MEEVLGQPLMVDDPRLTASQAARLLGISVSQFRVMVASGFVARLNEPGHRRYRLSGLGAARMRLQARQPPVPDSGPVQPEHLERFRRGRRVHGSG